MIHHDSMDIHSLSMHQLLNGKLAKLPTSLDSPTGVANT